MRMHQMTKRRFFNSNPERAVIQFSFSIELLLYSSFFRWNFVVVNSFDTPCSMFEKAKIGFLRELLSERKGND